MRTLLVFAFLSTNLLVAQAPEIPNSNQGIEREQLSEVINTEISETRPYITGDGKTLYFCRRNAESNVGGEKDFMDVYVSYQDGNGNWSEPSNLGGPINTKKNNAIATLGQHSADLYVLNTFNFRNIPLYVSKPKGDSWGTLEPVEVEDYYNESRFVDIHVSEENNAMIMAIERWDSRGDQDLYVSFRKTGNSWTKPQSLGRKINTREADFAPFLSADGTTLFFCSYGHRGNGNADIYASRRLDDSWEKWTKPVNLGEGINTAGEEVYFSITDDFEYMYLESFNPGTSNRDIVRAPVPDEVKPPAGEIDPMVIAAAGIDGDSTISSFSIAAIREVDVSQIPTPINQLETGDSDAVASNGAITDNTTDAFGSENGSENSSMDNSSNSMLANNSSAEGSSISPASNSANNNAEVSTGSNDNGSNAGMNTSMASANTTTQGGNSENTNIGLNDINSGAATSPDASTNSTSASNFAPNNSSNGTVVSQNNSGSQNATQAVNSGDADEYTANFTPNAATESLAKILRVEEIDGRIRINYLRNIYFEVGQNSLNAEAKIHLDRVYDIMMNDPSLILTLSGHSDITGAEKTNLTLSLRRARVAGDYLLNKGISDSRIQVNGFGGTSPLASNDDEVDGREYNRRVTIELESQD